MASAHCTRFARLHPIACVRRSSGLGMTPGPSIPLIPSNYFHMHFGTRGGISSKFRTKMVGRSATPGLEDSALGEKAVKEELMR
jgi:hypothetical protein